MTNAIQKLGRKLSVLLGENDPIDNYVLQQNATSDKVFAKNYLQDLIPYRLYDEGTLLYENTKSYGFVFELFPLIGDVKTVQEELGALVRALFLPGASIQSLLFADPFIEPLLKGWQSRAGKKGGIFSCLAEKRTQFLLQEALSEETPLGAAPRNFRFIFSYAAPKTSLSKELLIRKLETFRRKAHSTFSRFCAVKELRPKELIPLAVALTGMDKSTKLPPIRDYQKERLINEQIGSGGAVDVLKKGLVFQRENDLFFKSFQSVEEPIDWNLSLAARLTGDFFDPSYALPCPFFLHYGLSYADQRKEELSLNTKNKLLRQQFRLSGVFRNNPHLIEENNEHEKAFQLLKAGEKFIYSRFNVGLWASPKNFEDFQDRLEALFSNNGFKLQESHFFHLDDLCRSLPMAWGESPFAMDLKKTRCCKTTLTSEPPLLFPLAAEGRGNSNDGVLLLGRRGQVSFIDNFSTSSGTNATILARTGRGKSVLLAEMMFNRLGRGGRVFVFDKGRSFQNVVNLLGGVQLCFDTKSDLYLNPFAFIREGQTEKSDIAMMTDIICTMAMPDEKIDRDRKAILGGAVSQAWQAQGNEATIDTVIDFLEKAPLKTSLMLGAAESLAYRLRKFSSQGEYSRYFFGKKELSLKEDFIVFETQELSSMPDLKAVINQIFAFLVSKEVLSSDRERKSLIVIDEAHAQLESPQMESFCSTWAKEVRKYGSAVVCCTQSFLDMQKTPGAKGIYRNSNFLFLLADDEELLHEMRDKEGGEAVEQFGSLARSLKKTDDYSEMLVRDKDQKAHALYRLRLDPFSILLYSSNPQEFAALERLKQEGFSIEHAIEWLSPLRKEYRALIKDQDASIEEALRTLRKHHPISSKDKEVPADVL